MSHYYKYARPAVTVDCVIFGKSSAGMYVLLIQRKNPPYQDYWALPGGFLDPGESPLTAAARELEEETGLTNIPLTQFHTFGAPDRDPREHVIAIAHYGIVDIADHTPQAADDAADVMWISIDKLPRLAFDHNEVILHALAKVL